MNEKLEQLNKNSLTGECMPEIGTNSTKKLLGAMATNFTRAIEVEQQKKKATRTGQLFPGANPTTGRRKFNCENRQELDDKVSKASDKSVDAIITPINEGHDQHGVPLTKHALETFSNQIEYNEQNGLRAVQPHDESYRQELNNSVAFSKAYKEDRDVENKAGSVLHLINAVACRVISDLAPTDGEIRWGDIRSSSDEKQVEDSKEVQMDNRESYSEQTQSDKEDSSSDEREDKDEGCHSAMETMGFH
ncbi:hypothetical protein [Legionella waltersii]|uniref:Uncharacterized protein n=1 Tax=Legionella waltersii TaxID=66969 RepID=A0A0W1A161_9GAMM|nr:hypothetical protein [Legionella waltersii]KTD75105.1 hypothetical protein Lwal_3146 [Legionella waltersii]SNV05077.1 Uncharacterised protein [Legionella waltersii]